MQMRNVLLVLVISKTMPQFKEASFPSLPCHHAVYRREGKEARSDGSQGKLTVGLEVSPDDRWWAQAGWLLFHCKERKRGKSTSGGRKKQLPQRAITPLLLSDIHIGNHIQG